MIVAGWTGRDEAVVDHHIKELADIGVAPPSQVPLYYRGSATLLTHDITIQVVGDGSSGEVEPILIDDGRQLFIGLGSDHTDRQLEAHSVALSKQICAKPVAKTIWSYAEVNDHLDQLELRSWISDTLNDEWMPYQDGTLANIRPLADLIAGSPAPDRPARLMAGTAMMCGTLGAQGGVRPACFFRMELHDPVLNRSIEHGYETVFLPVIT